MNPPARSTSSQARWRAGLLLAALTLMGWLVCARWSVVLLKLGITDYGQWYLDSYAVLAASDAVNAGIDPNGVTNPLDPLHRGNSYSDWWLGLRWLGLTRQSNFLLGTTWVAAFALAAWFTLRPGNAREAAWLALLLLSPPVLLAVNRANNDLVIFVLVALSGVAAAGSSWGRQLLAVGALAVATGLKFYPAPGAIAFLWVRPLRRMPRVLLVAIMAAGAVLISVWPQMARGTFRVESGLFKMGAAELGRDLGLPDVTAQAAALGLFTLGALILVRTRCTAGLADRGAQRDRFLAAFGAILLLACFVAGVSYAYRWVFALWMALWLWREGTGLAPTPRMRWTARVACLLLWLGLWGDGCLCLFVNLFLPPLSQTRIDRLLLVWRWWTQPLVWLLLTLFAGWLLEAAWAILNAWWRQRRDSAAA